MPALPLYSTTVVGIGSNSGLTGSGFRVKVRVLLCPCCTPLISMYVDQKATNVILRNLQLSKSPAPTDLIELQTSTNIWVDVS